MSHERFNVFLLTTNENRSDAINSRENSFDTMGLTDRLMRNRAETELSSEAVSAANPPHLNDPAHKMDYIQPFAPATMHRVTIIGAGSSVFSSRVTADISIYDALRNTHFALVDVDSERLRYAEKTAHPIFKEGGYADETVSAHTDHTQVLEDVDCIIISILVGGYEAIKSEIDIAMESGRDDGQPPSEQGDRQPITAMDSRAGEVAAATKAANAADV